MLLFKEHHQQTNKKKREGGGGRVDGGEGEGKWEKAAGGGRGGGEGRKEGAELDTLLCAYFHQCRQHSEQQKWL